MAPTDPPELPRLPPIQGPKDDPPPAPEEPATPQETPAQARARERAQKRAERQEREPAAPAAPPPAEQPVAPDAETPPRESRGPLTEDGRRFSTAGHALIVAVLALVLASLLVAPGMHKSAYNGQPGTKRDIWLAVTGPLADVSSALFLDRPRTLLQDAMGRDGADEIDTAIEDVPPVTTTPAQTTPAETTTTPTTTTPTKPKPAAPVKQAFSPKKKLRIWVAGDSLVIVPGYALERAAGASPVLETVGGVDGHIATGLTRPDVFNWFDEIATKVKELKPNVVVLNFGGNDNHSYMTGLPEGTSLDGFAGQAWTREYLRRVRIVMNTINRAGATVVWIGLPIVRSETNSREFDLINAIVVKEAKRRGPNKAIYIDTYTMFAGNDGGYTEYLDNERGESVKVRAGDGVHFDNPGGEMIAREILKRLNEQFDLTSWRTKTGA